MTVRVHTTYDRLNSSLLLIVLVDHAQIYSNLSIMCGNTLMWHSKMTVSRKGIRMAKVQEHAVEIEWHVPRVRHFVPGSLVKIDARLLAGNSW